MANTKVNNPYNIDSIKNNYISSSDISSLPEPFEFYNAPLRYSAFSKYMEYFEKDLEDYTLADKENAPVFIRDNEAEYIYITLTDNNNNNIYVLYEKGNITDIQQNYDENISIGKWDLYKNNYTSVKCDFSAPTLIDNTYWIIDWTLYDDMGERYTPKTIPQKIIDYKYYHGENYIGSPSDGEVFAYTTLLLKIDTNKSIDLDVPFRYEPNPSTVGSLQILDGNIGDYYTIEYNNSGLTLTIEKTELREVVGWLSILPEADTIIDSLWCTPTAGRLYIKDPINKRHAYYQNLDVTVQRQEPGETTVTFYMFAPQIDSFSSFDTNNCEIYAEFSVGTVFTAP